MAYKVIYLLYCAVIFSVTKGSVYNLTNSKPLTPEFEFNGEFRYPCYVSVGVYTDPALRSPLKNGRIYVITTRRDGDLQEIGYSTETTISTGYACLLTLCYERAIIFVETDEMLGLEKLYFQNNSRTLFADYSYEIAQGKEAVKFDTFNWGTINGRTGPIYNYFSYDSCTAANTNGYHFAFSLLARKEDLTPTMSLDKHGEEMSWYYNFPSQDGFQACFLKVQVKVPTYQTEISLRSINADNGQLYGTFVAGPKASPTASEQVTKAACMEFRCAVRRFDDTLTTVIVSGSISGTPSTSCAITVGSSALEHLRVNGTSFSMKINSDDNYGSDYGIYKNKDRDTTKSMCYTGQSGNIIDYVMDPLTNFFLSYDCTESNVPIVGK